MPDRTTDKSLTNREQKENIPAGRETLAQNDDGHVPFCSVVLYGVGHRERANFQIASCSQLTYFFNFIKWPLAVGM